MNTLIKELFPVQGAIQGWEGDGSNETGKPVFYYSQEQLEQFAELIVAEHIKLLQREWYKLNNLSNNANESLRDIGMRVGKKSEIITLMTKIREHFGVK